MLRSGTRAPAFSAPDQTGVLHTLAQYRGKWVLLYAYPKDNTPKCTKEACAFRDAWTFFQQKGVEIFGISGDSVASHARFAKKYRLPFPLLSDPDRSILASYQMIGKKKLFGREYIGILRISYLIDPSGLIAKTYPRIDPREHAAEILADVKIREAS